MWSYLQIYNKTEELPLKNTSIRFRLIALVVVFALILIAGIMTQPKHIEDYTQYDCDVKNLRLSTEIRISSNNVKIGNVSGNIFRLIEDPLTLSDTDGNKIAYADDTYHFIAQDSHAIIVGDTVTAEMVGLARLLGTAYDIYNPDGKKIAHANFNAFNTTGELYDANGKLIATYGSFVYFNDFTVKVSKDCELDPYTVLMIFSSYYSDQAYDNS